MQEILNAITLLRARAEQATKLADQLEDWFGDTAGIILAPPPPSTSSTETRTITGGGAAMAPVSATPPAKRGPKAKPARRATTAKAPKSGPVAQVLAVLGRLPNPFRQADVEAVTDLERSQISYPLQMLVKQGVLRGEGSRQSRCYHKTKKAPAAETPPPVQTSTPPAKLVAPTPPAPGANPPPSGRGGPVHHAARSTRGVWKQEFTRDKLQTHIENTWPHLIARHAETPLGGVLSELVEWHELLRVREPANGQPAAYRWP